MSPIEGGELDVVVLAGGLGTRLAPVLPCVPKILAPVGCGPFLDHLLEWLAERGFHRVIFCLGHMANLVQEHLVARNLQDLDISVVVEPKPLGTAGAVAFASRLLGSDPVMIMNGDTLVDLNIVQFLKAYRNSGAAGSIVCTWVEDAARYGKIVLDTDDRVIQFVEKDASAGPSLISAGIYLLGRSLLKQLVECKGQSLERDFLQILPPATIHAFRTKGKFIDIGTPDTLARARELFAGARHTRTIPK
jgi:NDP-sugar pyrophosphorylase family protein